MDQHSDHQPTDMIPEFVNMTDDLPNPDYHPDIRNTRTASRHNGRTPRPAYHTTQPVTPPSELPAQPVAPPSELPAQPVAPPSELPAQPVTPPSELPTQSVTPPSELPTQPVTPPSELPAQPITLPSELPTQPVTPPSELPTLSVIPPSELPTQPVTPPSELPTLSVTPPSELPTQPVTPPSELPAQPITLPSELPTQPVTPPSELPTLSVIPPSELPTQPVTPPSELPTLSVIPPSELPIQLPTPPLELPTQPVTPPSELPTLSVIPPSELPTQPVTPPSELPTLSVIPPSELPIQLPTPPLELPTQPVTPPSQLPTPLIFLPPALTDILRALPSVYTNDVCTLFTVLPFERANLFARILTQIVNRLPPVLPSLLTNSSPNMSTLSPYFPTLFSEFQNTLMLMLMIHYAKLVFDYIFQLFPNASTSLLDNFQLDIVFYDFNSFRIYNVLSDIIHHSSSHFSSMWELKIVNLRKDLIVNLNDVLRVLVFTLNTQLDEDNGHSELVRLQMLMNNLWINTNTISNQIFPDPVTTSSESEESSDAESLDIENVTFQYVHQATADVKTDADKCTVCLEEMKDGDNARRLRCLHAFHKDCIDHWLEENSTCPMCRTHINATHEVESALNGA